MARFAVGADHAGFALKNTLADHLRKNGHEVTDLGTDSDERVDYPDFGAAVGRARGPYGQQISTEDLNRLLLVTQLLDYSPASADAA